MKVKFIIGIIIITGVGFYWYANRYFKIQERMRDFLVYSACDSGELDNYNYDESFENVHAIYDRIKGNLVQFDVEQWHLAHFGDVGNQKLTRISSWIGGDIVEKCGSETKTLEQARMFVATMLGIANSSENKGD